MDFKIENRVLDITNYPSVERHLENMANDGWLLTKIVFQNIFIYKRAKPEKLEFSISPYEVETMLTRKSKKELEEFQSVCESVGWDYATTSGDFHIYFKQKDAEAIEIETDDGPLAFQLTMDARDDIDALTEGGEVTYTYTEEGDNRTIESIQMNE